MSDAHQANGKEDKLQCYSRAPIAIRKRDAAAHDTRKKASRSETPSKLGKYPSELFLLAPFFFHLAGSQPQCRSILFFPQGSIGLSRSPHPLRNMTRPWLLALLAVLFALVSVLHAAPMPLVPPAETVTFGASATARSAPATVMPAALARAARAANSTTAAPSTVADGVLWQSIVTLLMIVGMLVAMAKEVAPPDMIMMLVVALFIPMGIITVEEGIEGFANKGMLTVAVLFAVAAGIQVGGGRRQLTERCRRGGAQGGGGERNERSEEAHEKNTRVGVCKKGSNKEHKGERARGKERSKAKGWKHCE